ncbi:hypothetical protein [Streptomyces sp. NBC_01614]|uniref:hypothetical protein n=1 Tax=Streptomyces sp. NBC_01614 TaxID=2975897 RepID=UPI0038676C9D
MIAEAIDTALTLAWALAGWVIFLATVAAILALAATATGVWGVRALRRAVKAPLAAEHAPQAPESTRAAKRRPTPSWAHTQPLDYEEAA